MLEVIDNLQIHKENSKIPPESEKKNHQFLLSLPKVQMRLICIQIAVQKPKYHNLYKFQLFSSVFQRTAEHKTLEVFTRLQKMMDGAILNSHDSGSHF